MHYLLPHLVDNAAERAPEHAAVRCRGEAISYADLAQRSDALAAALAELGVRRGDRVGLLLGKRLECAVAIHGIMKAGAAYVPLDPGSPPQRHAFVLRDCGIRHLVTESSRAAALRAVVAEGVAPDVVIGLDEDTLPGTCVSWQGLDAWQGRAAPATDTMEQDLCYVLYTSGSTGVPKGIMHTHRSAIAWAETARAAYGLTDADRISNYAQPHFDLSTLDYYASPLAGATMVMIPEEHTRMPASLSALLQEEGLTVLYTVPLALIQLATFGAVDKRDLAALRWVLFGGEPMPPKHLATLMQGLPQTRFANVYGPTETNGCTHYVVPPDPAALPAALPIGRPYANVDATVVDANDAPVGPGTVGELLIRAPTMMQGYWNRSDLNERAFYDDEPVAGFRRRYHRTGDLVERDADGLLHFHGRKDRQIKTRGCRVDLDEVEAALVAHSEVHEGAVYALPDASGTLAIRAAAIPTADADANAKTLLQHLKAALPAYAVPQALDILEDFPRTSTGKIDRRALAAAASPSAA